MRTPRIPLLTKALFAAVVVSMALVGPAVLAHCQIPCGIYGDETRFVTMREHVTTLDKSMKQITELGKESSPNWNQLVRWVDNKESHADELAEIITYYFMSQRIKPPAADADDAAKAKYQKEIGILHKMLIHTMKAKQSTDPAHIEALNMLIDKLEASYLGKHEH